MPNKIIKLTILSLCFLIGPSVIRAASSPDAIAIRVIPNPEHYSALRWYEEQGFSGSPQSLVIDGYEAVRDGRTVYVNAANITGDTMLYTNIYLISYNQGAEQATADIFGQILAHWKFNKNIKDAGNCIDDEGNPGDVCLIDSECPAGRYCSSPKAKTTRDTRRLADLAEMKIALESYRQTNGKYPELIAGTYLTGRTLSTWPSWQEVLANQLKFGLPNDPVNKLGECSGYDAATCWSEQDKKFADSDPADPALNLPVCSHAYVYAAQAGGVGYDLCGVMESGLLTSLEQGACAGSAAGGPGGGGGGSSAVGEIGNNPPTFSGITLPEGISGKKYEGFIGATDPDGDHLIWSIDTSGTAWTGWSAPPILQNTAAANQKKIYADKAGNDGIYNFSITVNDGRSKPNSVITQSYSIKIINHKPIINQPINCAEDARINLNYICAITAGDPEGNAIASYNVLGLPAGLAINSASGEISGTPNTAGAYSLTITATDEYGTVSDSAIFNLRVNTYCGDGVQQNPNLEGKGGPVNDGNEQCDSPANVAASPAASSPTNQYSCSGACPLGGACAGTCAYAGGWCGDGVVQSAYGEDCDPNETKADFEARYGIAITNEVWAKIQNACNNCQIGCLDKDSDGYGVCPYCGHAKGCSGNGNDCDDEPNGVDGLAGTLDDGANINPGEPDDCTQYDEVDNNCNGSVDEHTLLSGVLTNVGFEAGAIGGLPTDWTGSSQLHASVGITNAQAYAGAQSVLMHQDANLLYPGFCNQITCGDLGHCAWLAGTSQCQFNGSDLCNPLNPAPIYNLGAELCWGNTNRVMWGNLAYDVSTLGYNVGDIYILHFYYKGNAHFENTMIARLNYTMGYVNQCYEKALYPLWVCDSNPFGGDCADRPGWCCLHATSAAQQTDCYEYVSFPPIQDNNYINWTVYSGSFVYTPGLAKVLDDSGNLQHQIGIAIGYNNTGPSGSNIYIDNFRLLKCVNN